MTSPRPLRTMSGATMIEVLVALFVLSVGLLGVAAMQQVGLRNSHSAHLRSQATALAYDIADRMRANVRLARAQAYDSPLGSPFDVSSCTTVLNDADQVVCDLAQWRQALADVLPAGRGSVDVGPVDPATGMQPLTVVVEWDDSRGEFPPVQFQTMSQL